MGENVHNTYIWQRTGIHNIKGLLHLNDEKIKNIITNRFEQILH